jgi:phosphatidylcholine synthase
MRLAAALVHTLTALGAVCAFFALEAVGEKDWEGLFAWLGVALLIDGLDGPLARLVGVRDHLPRFSGERLDLVVDFLTYVFVPAVALVEAHLLEGALGELLAAAILVSSLYHFSDLKSKAGDNAFVGFPAVWNLVAFYLFAFGAGVAATSAVVALCIALTFVPTRWVHPIRVRPARPLTIALMSIWAVAAVTIVHTGFGAAPWAAKAALAAVAAYAILLPFVWPRTAEGPQ